MDTTAHWNIQILDMPFTTCQSPSPPPPPLPNLHRSVAGARTMVKRASTKRCRGGSASEAAGSRKGTSSCTRLKEQWIVNAVDQSVGLLAQPVVVVLF
jgi:hypothetical protein